MTFLGFLCRAYKLGYLEQIHIFSSNDVDRRWLHSWGITTIYLRPSLRNPYKPITLNDPLPRFQGYAVMYAEYIRNVARYLPTYNKILIRSYAFSKVSFPVTLSDLVKYLVTRSIVRSLCDSSAFASFYVFNTRNRKWENSLFSTCYLCE